jgi:molybdopterin-guanine dinucleotide biosynthesis protein A
MARDKARLSWGTGDLLDHAIARLREVAADVAILSGRAPRYADRGLPVVTDPAGGDGPIAGLEAGLAHAEGRPVVLLAVDLPLVPAALLRALVEGLAGFDAVVPFSPRGREPLCAAYGPACLASIRTRVALDERGLSDFWPDVRVRRVPPAELRAFGDPEAVFMNVNEPADLQRAKRLAGGL